MEENKMTTSHVLGTPADTLSALGKQLLSSRVKVWSAGPTGYVEGWGDDTDWCLYEGDGVVARQIAKDDAIRMAAALNSVGHASLNTMLQLSELMRGLEIPPTAMHLEPRFFYKVAKAVADQAKQANQTITNRSDTNDEQRSAG